MNKPGSNKSGSASSVRDFVRKMTKVGEDGAHVEAGLLRHIWAWIVVHVIAFKLNFIELVTRHRKLPLEKIGKRTGDVAVITGGARGLGVEVVRKMLQFDMQVYIGCRNIAAGNKMIEKLRAEGVDSGQAECLPLDLKSLQSVKKFAQQLNSKTDRVNILINNAGIMFVPYEETEDGFESHFQVNYLSHFYLTQLLQPSLVKGSEKSKRNSRVVNVSSCAHFGGRVDFADLQSKRSYSKFDQYMITKFMQVLSSNTLDRKWTEQGLPIHSYSLHPGVVLTDLYDNIPWLQLFSFCLPLMFKSPAQGADTVCHAALSPELDGVGGLYFENSSKQSPNPRSSDVDLQNKFWDVTKEILEGRNLTGSQSS